MPRSDIPVHRKLGYDHMLEMRGIEAQLRADGVTGVALHFAAVAQYERAHQHDPNFRQRQAAAKAIGAAWVSTDAAPSRDDLMRLALEEIRDGHNDPRALAQAVLGKVI